MNISKQTDIELELTQIANNTLWETPHEKQAALIEKFGSRKLAMQQTFILLYRGIHQALENLTPR